MIYRIIINGIKLIFLVIFTIAALILIPPVIMMIFGYHVNATGWEVAVIAADEGDVEVCKKIASWGIFGPPAHEQRTSCIYEFAEKTQKPEVCTLLLPNQYAWSCLGAVKSKLSYGFGCGSTDENINCGYVDIYVKNQGIVNCNIYKEKVLQDWCHDERTAMLDDVYECDLISEEPAGLREECQMRYAFKLKNTSLCEPIINRRRKKLCEIEIDVWNKYADKWGF